METLRGKVVVVTGASSGLGREAAIRFAREGCILVLASRREDALEETAALCRHAGGTALCVPTDVTREEDVKRLADAALDYAGHVDVWVNNAGVTLFAPLDQAPFDEHRRVIETNLFGPMLCARAIVPVFRRQRHGVLINVGSVLSKVGQPFVPSYVISKFGLRGLSEALRADLADLPDVHVCTLLPYAMDTPHFEAGANYVGRGARPMSPIQSPEKVAQGIVDLAKRPRRELLIPRYIAAGLLLHDLMPGRVDRLILDTLREWHFGDEPEPVKHGNLFAPSDERPQVHGRPPKGRTPALATWLVRRLLGMGVQPHHDEAEAPAPNAAVREHEPA